MTIMTKLSLIKDINGLNSFGAPFSNSKYQALLTAGIGDSVTVPPTGDATYSNVLAIFSFDPGDSVWVSINGTAVVPNSTFTLSECELNPSARKVKPGDVISMITSDTVDQVGVIFYAVT